MRDEKIISYEKPELVKYAFYGVTGVLIGEASAGGDIDENCDTEFDS